jgi:hypothetical protein
VRVRRALLLGLFAAAAASVGIALAQDSKHDERAWKRAGKPTPP